MIIFVVVVFLLVLLVYILRPRRLVTIPGPKPHWLLGNLMEMRANMPRFNEWMMETMQKYGKSCSITLPLFPPFITTTDPGNVEHVLKTNFDNYVKGEFLADLLMDMLGKGIFASDGAHWKAQRAIASHLFTKNTLHTFISDTFYKNGLIVIKLLQAAAEAKEDVDMQDIFQKYTLDSIGKIAFGVNLDCLTKQRVPFAEAFDTAQSATHKRMFSPLWKLERSKMFLFCFH